MKVSELGGPLLDFWVARAEGFHNPRIDDGFCWVTWVDCPDHPSDSGEVEECYTPSTDWSIAGPIIARERINLEFHGSDMEVWCAYGSEWPDREEFDNLPLIAAMRAYVAGKFGEEVPGKVPE